MSKNILQGTSNLDNNYYLQEDEKQELYVYFELKAGIATTSKERIPLNIALVIDRSGSMAGDKLRYVKKATDFVIDNLNAHDHLAIVQYDSHVDVVSATQTVTNKKKLHSLVAKIRAGGTTNLSGGMLEGYNQVDASKADNLVNRVLLLSDGLANVGITEPSKLQNIAQKKFRELGMGLSTFGVGEGFNELLMTNLAEYGGANYYFIDTPDRIPEIFAKELEGLLSVVAQNAKLKITFPNHAVMCNKVYGYPAVIGASDIQIDFNDVFSEEQKAILVKFTLKRPLTTALQFGVNFTYDDATTFDKVTNRQDLTLRLTTDKNLYQKGVNPTVAQNITLFVANDLYEQAIKAVDANDNDKAKAFVAKAIAMLEATLALFPTNQELKEQLNQVKAYSRKIDEMKNWTNAQVNVVQKSSRMSNYRLRKKR